MKKPMDRRVRRTRRRLREALIALILEKGYDPITIQDITDRADLSRATFYLHYRDKDELLANSLEAMFDELVASMKVPLTPNMLTADGQPPALLAFEHVQEHSALYKALLLGERGVTYVIYREINYLARIAEQHILSALPAEALARAPVALLAQHIAGSLFALIVWWLENDMPQTPETMARRFHQLAMPGVLYVAGLDVDIDPLAPDQPPTNSQQHNNNHQNTNENQKER